MKMHENSLFAVLLRSPWWISFGLGGVLIWVSRALLPAEYVPYAIFTGLPFLVIGGVALWRQMRTPSAERVGAALEKIRALSWEEFAAALEAAYKREGYDVKRVSGAADFELEKSGRLTLVAAKRWKATRTGIEPLRDLDALRQKREARDAVYVAAGEVTDTARAFAVKSGIQLLETAALAGRLGKM